ncbi:YopX family protein [Enterovibrio sp. 27052020O]|uniref:YopX family protein n=1 Tax=Enterovibrio sp. 27052020O TaxID=3241166 RepID=UPI00388CF3D8
MRQIKFRGLWGEQFVYGHYFSQVLPGGDLYEAIVLKDEFGDYRNHLTKSGTVGQFTGLKDKNGVEIYEGDIIAQHLEWSGGYMSDECGEMEFIGVASITASSGVVLNKCKSRDIIECDTEWTRHKSTINVRGYRCEVIGNIHHNPGLIK